MKTYLALVAAVLVTGCATVTDTNIAKNANTSRTGWEYIAGGKGLEMYIDYSTIRRIGNVVELWDKVEYEKPIAKGITKGISRARYDCVNERSKTLYYQGWDASGEIAHILRFNDAQDNWFPVVPGSVSEAVFRSVCG